MEDGIIERRLLKRLNVECSARLKKEGDEFPMQIKNISAQGVGFQTQKTLKPSDRMTIIVSTTSGSEPLVLSGVVIWTKEREDGNNDVGIKLDITSWEKMSKVLAR